MTKIADLRSQTVDQLSDELLKLKKEQFNLRFQAATGQMEKTHRVSEVRKDIAGSPQTAKKSTRRRT